MNQKLIMHPLCTNYAPKMTTDQTQMQTQTQTQTRRRPDPDADQAQTRPRPDVDQTQTRRRQTPPKQIRIERRLPMYIDADYNIEPKHRLGSQSQPKFTFKLLCLKYCNTG